VLKQMKLSARLLDMISRVVKFVSTSLLLVVPVLLEAVEDVAVGTIVVDETEIMEDVVTEVVEETEIMVVLPEEEEEVTRTVEVVTMIVEVVTMIVVVDTKIAEVVVTMMTDVVNHEVI